MRRKTKSKYWLKRDYKAFAKTIEGRKIIDISRVLARGISNIEEIKQCLGFSTSEIRKLLRLAEESEWVHSYPTRRIRRSRGKPGKGSFEKETGRPPRYYALEPKGLFYMRFDPALKDDWKAVESEYSEPFGPSSLEDYNNLKYAIQKHPVLSKYKSPYYFDGILQRKPLNPFLFQEYPDNVEFDSICEELVRLIRENVRPEHIRPYRTSLQDSVLRLRKIIKRHAIVIEKLKLMGAAQQKSIVETTEE